MAAGLSSTVGGPADGLGRDAHRQAERQLLAAWGQPSQQLSRIAGRRFAWGRFGRARREHQRGQRLLLGAGVDADRAWCGVEQVGVVGHTGALTHVVAEQVQVPGALEVISRWLVAGPMDLDNSRRCWRAHGASYRRRGGGTGSCPAEARECPKRPIGHFWPQRPSWGHFIAQPGRRFRRRRRRRQVERQPPTSDPSSWNHATAVGTTLKQAVKRQHAMRLTTVELWLQFGL
jgi:hypothetical protein